jgi:PAS domain S-box-containing protein
MYSLIVIIVALSAVFQFIAAFMAIRMIRVSGALLAWSLLASAFSLMGVRRAVSISHIRRGLSHGDLSVEVLALLISLLVMCGVWLIRFLFERMKQSKDELAAIHQELVESEIRYRTVAEFTSDWEFWVAPDKSLRYISPSCEQISGYTADDFYRDPKLILKIVHPEDVARYKNHMHEIQENGQPMPIDFRITTRDGQERWISHVCRPVVDRDGSPLGQRASNRDITNRKRAEAELQESEQRYRQLNETLEQRIEQAVDELRQKDQLLLIQSREAVMGEMVGNIAHQWRQPLNTLGLIAQEMQLTYRMGEFSGDCVEINVKKILEIIRHMSNTIDDFRNFFRPGTEKEEFKVRVALEKSLSLLEASLTAQNIRTEVVTTDDPVIYGYPNEFSQVLLNILTNARDAFASGLVPDPLVVITVFNEAGKTVVTVADNAGGIPEEIIDKIFDPYFTTKGPEHGTGIGLFMCKTIIEKNMNGAISARNVGSGVEFRIEF